MVHFRLINTQGSLLNSYKKDRPFYVLKKDSFNNFLWKQTKITSLIKKNTKLSSFKKHVLSV